MQYSNDYDCYELYKMLKRKMGDKIDYYGTPYNALFKGEYFSPYKESKKGIPFYYKYCQNVFLRIQVGSSRYHQALEGEKLATLSDFYEVLSEVFGEPTVFYTTKDDKEELLSLQWSFVNKEEDIKKFKEGTYFDDAQIDELIVIDESKERNGYHLSDLTKKLIAKRIGVPFALIPLVDENIEDFIKFKTGRKLIIPDGAKIEGLPVTSIEKEMSLQRKIN